MYFFFHLVPARHDRFGSTTALKVYAKFHGRLRRRVRFSPLSFFIPHARHKATTHLNLA